MKQVVKWPLLAVVLLAIPWSVANAATPLGMISGTVKDADGRPLAGALVSIHNATGAEEVLKSTKTDNHGRFLAANLSPGRYTLRATAEGYKSELIAAVTVVPSRTSISNFTLRRASELLDPQEEAESYKYIIRRNRHIFQWDESEPVVAQKEPFARQTHGVINFCTTRAVSEQAGAASFTGLNFALAQMLNSNLELVVAGQTGIGSISPQRLETQASVLAGDNHQLTFTIGYGHLPTFDRGSSTIGAGGFNQYSARVTDRWHIAGPVVLLYGFDYSRFDGGAQVNQFTPRLNIDLQLSGRDQLFAAIYSPSGADIESSAEFETTRIDFHGPVELINLDAQTPVDQSRRYEIGYTHTFRDRSKFEAALFLDRVANHSVGLLSVPSEAEQESEPDTPARAKAVPIIEERGRARGLRVIFTHPLTSNISASFGYSFGEGQQLNISADGQPSFSIGYFQVFSGKLDAQIVRTGTHISAVLRLASPNAVFAIDPFQQRLGVLDPNISIYLTQSLPMFNFIPGRWEANLDARNLLDTSSSDDRLRLAIGQYWRSIRGGFTVRF